MEFISLSPVCFSSIVYPSVSFSLFVSLLFGSLSLGFHFWPLSLLKTSSSLIFLFNSLPPKRMRYFC